jgi:DNA-binding CsgD family transcriptional regulator
MINSVYGSRSEQKHEPQAAALTSPVVGIMLLSASRAVAYITPAAQILLQILYESEGTRAPSRIMLPSVVHKLFDDIQFKLSHCKTRGDWTQITVHQIVHTATESVSLRGLVLPDSESDRPNRMLVVLERLTASSTTTVEASTGECQLTARQHAIVRGLMRGLTNKELANELCISAHTVKEYVRVIMGKVRATSRTGVVGRLSGIINQETPALPIQRSRPGRHESQRDGRRFTL